MNAAPGWYPDPEDPTRQRWHNGHDWTTHTQIASAGGKKRKKWPWIVGAAVVALALYIGISAATGFQTQGRENNAAATQTTISAPTSTVDQQAAAAAASSASAAAEASRQAAAALRAARLDKSTYEAIDSRGWQLVAKNPDSHVGEKYVIYGRVMQSDAATGSTSMRVNTDGQQVDYYDMDINTIANAGLATFSDVVEDDLVTMWVVVSGSQTYDTTMGGSVTAPEVEVNVIEVTGSTG